MSSLEQSKRALLLVRRRITEKAALLSEQRQYTFDVQPNANKQEIKKAFEELYKKKPMKVRILQGRNKTVRRKQGVGEKRGSKKAVVVLKVGEKIEFV